MAELDGTPVGLDQLQALALTNYGHFTSMRVEDGRVRGLALHLERLVRDCRTVFDVALDAERVRDLVRRAVPAVGTRVVRVTVFDPDLDLGHMGGHARPRVLVTSRPTSDLPLPPLRVGSVAFVRDMPAVKSVGLFGALRHRRDMQRAGFDDALFVDGDSFVSEGGTWNIGFVRGDQVVWPEAECLAGTTMELVKQVHHCITRPLTLTDAADFEAAFATNVAIGVRAVASIDHHQLSPTHPTIEALHRKYLAVPGDPV